MIDYQTSKCRGNGSARRTIKNEAVGMKRNMKSHCEQKGDSGEAESLD